MTVDITGMRFGRLVALSKRPRPKGEKGGSRWFCRCDCGVEKVIRSHCLRVGMTKSCGCLKLGIGKKVTRHHESLQIEAAKLAGIDIITRSEAIAVGQSWYFNGIPCVNGHAAKRLVVNHGCKQCAAERQKAARPLNRERSRQQKKISNGQRRVRLRGTPDPVRATINDVENIMEFQGRRCVYCDCTLDGREVHNDHIVPVSKGGSNRPCNIQKLCARCNLDKWTRDAREFVSAKAMAQGYPRPLNSMSVPEDAVEETVDYGNGEAVLKICKEDGRIATVNFSDPSLDMRELSAVISMALKSGVSAAYLRAALPRRPDGTALGPTGALLDVLATSASRRRK